MPSAREESQSPLLPRYQSKYDDDTNEDTLSNITLSGETPYTADKLEHDRTYVIRSSKSGSEARWTWLRWSIVVFLQAIIIAVLLLPKLVSKGEIDPVLKGKVIETGDDINGLYKTFSHTYTYLKPEAEKYVPNMTSNANRAEVRRNWDLLMPRGSGSIAIQDYRDHPLLGDPITDDPLRSGPIFEASWTHAMHCLYYSVDSYHQLIVNGRSENDDPYHAAHCFEYLRTSILCNLDMTLEGSMSKLSEKDRGQPHVCRNRQEAIEWIEARRVDDLQDVVGPTAAVVDEKRI